MNPLENPLKSVDTLGPIKILMCIYDPLFHKHLVDSLKSFVQCQAISSAEAHSGLFCIIERLGIQQISQLIKAIPHHVFYNIDAQIHILLLNSNFSKHSNNFKFIFL